MRRGLSLLSALLLGARLAAAAEPVPPPKLSPPDTWLPRTSATLRLLDKLSAQVSTVTVPVGGHIGFGSLTIAVQACVVRPPDLPPDAAARLAITDSHPGGPGFEGWMLSGEPAAAMLEHPVYGVSLAGCGPA